MKLEYKAETEDDIADLANCALSIRALASQGKMVQRADIGDELYYDKIQTFTLIETLLEPILTFLVDDAMNIYGAEQEETMKQELCFKEPPRIGNRTDALELLDRLLTAENTQGLEKAPQALKNAIEREII